MIEMLMPQLWPLLQIIMIDVVLAGDNAVVVGLAASRVNPTIRGKVIFWGIAAAVVLRILFAGVTMHLLAVKGIMLVGGLLLFYVCWNMYKELRGGHEPEPHSLGAAATEEPKEETKFKEMSFFSAVTQITIADVSMSLDNVLAVAGAAGESTLVLVIGLAIAIVLMAVASSYIARLLHRYPGIAWIGLLIILYVALDMIYRDSHHIACRAYGVGCSETIWQGIMHRLGLGG